MSTTENDVDGEAVSDREKVQCRRNRRPSVQFIDKSLIRRRSSGLEKTPTHIQQVPRLPSIHSHDELEDNDDQHTTTTSLPTLQKEDCENFPAEECCHLRDVFFICSGRKSPFQIIPRCTQNDFLLFCLF